MVWKTRPNSTMNVIDACDVYKVGKKERNPVAGEGGILIEFIYSTVYYIR